MNARVVSHCINDVRVDASTRVTLTFPARPYDPLRPPPPRG